MKIFPENVRWISWKKYTLDTKIGRVNYKIKSVFAPKIENLLKKGGLLIVTYQFCFLNLCWIHKHRTHFLLKLKGGPSCKMVPLVHGRVRCGFWGLGHNMMNNDILCNINKHWKKNISLKIVTFFLNYPSENVTSAPHPIFWPSNVPGLTGLTEFVFIKKSLVFDLTHVPKLLFHETCSCPFVR